MQPTQLTQEQIHQANKGDLFRHYAPSLPWLRPVWSSEKDIPDHASERDSWIGATHCESDWMPIGEGWQPSDSCGLWLAWEKLLPLFLDPTVEEIWIQRIENQPSGPTPRGSLEVLSDGLLGVRQHPALRMLESELLLGFTKLLSKRKQAYYELRNPDGTPIVESPLEPPGVRLAGGVPPLSTAPFAAIRIPARTKPTTLHCVGAKVFGQDYDRALVAAGVPLAVVQVDPLEEARQALRNAPPEGRVMLPLEALEYIKCAFRVGWNVVFAGATSSAKTTVMNAALSLMPSHWRIVTLENNVLELKLPHTNWLPLLSSDGLKFSNGEPMLSPGKVMSLVLRLSPKPIPAGEIRGEEGYLWVKGSLTGHESSPTTLHAGSPDEAVMRLTTDMILKGNPGMSEKSAKMMACRAANVIVQLAREEVVEGGKIVSLRRCVSIHEIQTTGSYIEENLSARVVEVFSTTRTPKGPVLQYNPRAEAKLWKVMRDRLMDGALPSWAPKG